MTRERWKMNVAREDVDSAPQHMQSLLLRNDRR